LEYVSEAVSSYGLRIDVHISTTGEVHSVYQNSTAKFGNGFLIKKNRGFSPLANFLIQTKKRYDNMGPEMYGYRVTELRISDSYSIVAGTTSRMLLLQDNAQETRLVNIVDDMDTVGVLLALSRSSYAAHTSAGLTALCLVQNFDLQC
jgi:hypothetical protein